MVFPLFLLAVNTGGLESAARLPGFPADSYLDFALAFAFMQGALFAVSNGGAISPRTSRQAFSTDSR